jgi:Domain of unknown function (DUF3846)
MAKLYMAGSIRPIEVLPANRKKFTLEELQGFVGGYIELLWTVDNQRMYVNEDGKSMGLEVNRAATDLLAPKYQDRVVGNALICGRNEVQ